MSHKTEEAGLLCAIIWWRPYVLSLRRWTLFVLILPTDGLQRGLFIYFVYGGFHGVNVPDWAGRSAMPAAASCCRGTDRRIIATLPLLCLFLPPPPPELYNSKYLFMERNIYIIYLRRA